MPSNDFSKRSDLTEWMDEPCPDGDLFACLRDLEAVNRMVFVYRPTLRWLERVVPARRRALHIVDVGCGGGDMLRAIERWAVRRSIALELTGVDCNARAILFARTHTGPMSRVRYVQGDAAESPEVRDVDIVLSSHMTHHLTDPEIVRFLAWMESTARVGWFINDLHREPMPYHAFRLLSRVMRWHRFIQHDGPISVLRSFQPEDWARYLEAAGVQGAAVTTSWPGRLCVEREKADA